MATAISFAAMSRAAAAAARALTAPAVKVCAAGATLRKQPTALPQLLSGALLSGIEAFRTEAFRTEVFLTEVFLTEVPGTEVVARRGARLGAAKPRPSIEHSRFMNLKVAVH
jgi:hypothetical protein